MSRVHASSRGPAYILSLLSRATAIAFLSANAPAAAQATLTTIASADAGCRVLAEKSSAEGQSQLVADCGGHGVLLGPATEVRAMANTNLGAILVDARIGSSRRILLLTRQPDGLPLLEDMNGEIALAAGRGPLSDLDGITIDFPEFAKNGTLAVHGLAADTGPDRADRIDIGEQIAVERARHFAAQK